MVIPIGYAMITHIYTGPSVPRNAVITYGVRNDTGLNVQQVAGACAGAYDASNFDALCSSDCDMVVTRAKLGPTATGPYFDYPFTTGGAGTASGGAQVALLFQKITEGGGRRGRGRLFVPGTPEAAVDPGGRLTSGTMTTATDAGQALLDELESRDLPMYLLHDDVSTAPNLVLGLVPSPFVATQRRRQPRQAF